MDTKFYIRARQKGLKAYSQAIQQNRDPYLPVLEEKVPNLNKLDRLSLGVQSIPLERVVGSVSQGRSYAFAENFMPILETNSEFSGKWAILYASVVEEGLREPAKVLEYMGYYYLIEGNKRVSVMKFIGAEYLEADVTRVIPERTDDPAVKVYFEYCAFSKATGLYDIFFTKPGSYDRLTGLPGVRNGETWDHDEILSLRKIYHYFYTAYRTVMQNQPSLPVGDAFLRWLLAFGYMDVKDSALSDVEKSLRLMQEEFKTRSDTVSLVMDQADNAPAPRLLQSLFHPAKIRAAFLYTKPPEESAWNYWHELGRLEAQEKLGDRVETVSRIVTSRSQSEQEIDRLISEGCNVVFATSPVMLNSCIEPALKHPDTKLLVSSQLAGYRHVHTYYLRFYEVKFLLGVLAGILSDTGKIGYLADYPIYGSPSMINAFAIGARMVNPKARVYLNWTSLKSFDPKEPFHDPEIQVVCNRDRAVSAQRRRNHFHGLRGSPLGGFLPPCHGSDAEGRLRRGLGQRILYPFLLVGNLLGYAGSGFLLPLPSREYPAGPQSAGPDARAVLHPLRRGAGGSERRSPLYGGPAPDAGGNPLHGLSGGLRDRIPPRSRGAGSLRPGACADPGHRQHRQDGRGIHFLDLRVLTSKAREASQ